MDIEAAKSAVTSLLLALDQDINSADMRDTPRRVAEMLAEQCVEKDAEIDVTFAEDSFGGMVIVRDIPFVGMCPHHLVFFSGKAHIAYIPKRKVLGISKLARLVYSCSVGFVTQEHITNAIAERLYENDDINCLGCAVVMIAEHGCMSLRGAKAQGASTITSEMRGVFMTVPAARQEFLDLVHQRSI
jgi:GTP cyclohydrolase I